MGKQSHCCGSNSNVMRKVMLRRRVVMVFMQRAVVSNDGDGIFHNTSSLGGCDGGCCDLHLDLEMLVSESLILVALEEGLFIFHFHFKRFKKS